MKTKVFETSEGVELFFDEKNYSYSSSNITAVEAALKEDMDNYKRDPVGAAMAYNLMTIMVSMDRYHEMVS